MTVGPTEEGSRSTAGDAVAFVDESLRQGPAGICVVIAALVVRADAVDARRRARGLLLPGQARFLWRDESPRRRAAMIAVIGELGPTSLAYVCRPVDRGRQERARALCIERLFWDLGERRVARVVIESRGSLDRRDNRTIAHARRAGKVPTSLAYDFGDPRVEPLLWIADALAGATAAHVAGEGSEHFQSVEAAGLIHVERIDL